MTYRDKVVCSTRSTTSTRKDATHKLSRSAASVSSKRGERVRRRLFDDINCVDPTDWVNGQLQLIDEVESTTLGYDFRNECPIINGHVNEYIFEAVDEREVPSFYHSKTSSFNRRERIAPPNTLESPRRLTSPFVVVMPVHDSVAYNTRSHDIITFGDNSRSASVPESSVSTSRSRNVRRDGKDTQCNNEMNSKQKLDQQSAALNRKRSMKQQTLPEYLPVVRCKRQQSVNKKALSNDVCSERKNFTSATFRTCKAQESSTANLVADTGSLEVKSCTFSNRRITRSMCA